MQQKTINLTLLSTLLDHVQNIKSAHPKDYKTNQYYSINVDMIDMLCELLPSGSGIDAGTKFDLESSKPDRLVFTLSYHHMNDNGYYTHWTDHTIIIVPTFAGYDMRITGRNYNMVKDYLGDIFNILFTVTSYEYAMKEKYAYVTEMQKA